MFRGDPRRPWIDISSEKITQRHLGMVALQTYLREKSNSLDAIPAIEFLDEHLQPFSSFLAIFEISKDDILVPVGSKGALDGYKGELEKSLSVLKQKRDDHPELFETDDSSDSGKKSLLDQNQYIHSVLDRKAALDLLNWGETGARVSAIPYEKQQYLLKSLEQILQISGIHIDVNHESVTTENKI